jgi:prepilin-type N-terminal cleavage/methylation domain-containing protein
LNALHSRNPRVHGAAFTLIELLLVMALLTVVMALVSPSLGPFLRGRSLGYEVRRFISLTRLAQSRAAHEGVPMRLWVDPDLRMYGMDPEFSFDTTTPLTAPGDGQPQSASGGRSIAYPLASDVQVEADPRSWASMSGNTFALQFRWAAGQGAFAQGRRITFRFTPDGSIDETSPWGLWFRSNRDPVSSQAVRPGDEVYVSQNYARTRYEVQTNQLAIPVR